MFFLKQSTTVTVNMGPALDKTDGVTPETALSPTVYLSKNGGIFAVRNSATAITHDRAGHYRVELNATDTDTLGRLRVEFDDAATHIPVWEEFMVLPANVYDSIVDGSDKLQVDLREWIGVAPAALVTQLVQAYLVNTALGAIPLGSFGDNAIDTAALALNAVAEIADGVWDEARSGHVAAGSFGEGVASVQGNVTGNVNGNVTGNVGSLGAQAKADVNAEVDAALDTAVPGTPTANSINERVKTLDDNVTATRAGYLDKLNITGNVASSAEVTAIQNNTRTTIAVPGVMERPDSGSTRFKLYLNNYDTVGNMEEPDSAPTMAVVNQEGTDRSGNLQHPTTHVPQTTMVQIEAGRYWIEYDLDTADAMEGLIFTFTIVEGGATRKLDRASLIVDTTAVDFTAADRAKLDTLHDTRLTAARAANLDNLDAAMSTRATPAQVNTECDTALADVNLDHLVGTATGIPAIPAGTFFDQIMDDGTATFDRLTDSLQAIRDRGDAAWGGSGGESRNREGTAQAGSANSITLDAGASSVNDFYKNQRCFIDAGTGAGQCEIIASYVGATKVATPAANWATAPDATSHFRLLPLGTIPGASAPTAAQVSQAVCDELASTKRSVNRNTGDIKHYRLDGTTVRGTLRPSEVGDEALLVPQ